MVVVLNTFCKRVGQLERVLLILYVVCVWGALALSLFILPLCPISANTSCSLGKWNPS